MKHLLSFALLALLTGCTWTTSVDVSDTDESDTESGTVIYFPEDAGEDTSDSDGYVKINGEMMAYVNGELSPMQPDIALNNGAVVREDGTVQMSDGMLLFLEDGDMVTLNGDIRTEVDTSMMMQGGDNEAMMEDDSMGEDDDAMMEDDTSASAQYTAYETGVVGNGEPSVLFFHASWCPYCKANDAKLTAWETAGLLDVPVYKVNYDTELDLKQQFGIVTQDSYVLIDAEGNAVQTITSPSEAQLQDLVQA